jgi:hypothetical protein
MSGSDPPLGFYGCTPNPAESLNEFFISIQLRFIIAVGAIFNLIFNFYSAIPLIYLNSVSI